MDDDHIEDDEDQEQDQDDDDSSSHFGYRSGSVEDEKNNHDDSVLTMHMNERVNSIPDEDAMISMHQGLHFSKNSGNSNMSRPNPTTMIMYETARSSVIEEGHVDPVVQDSRSRVYKNLLGLDHLKKEKAKKDGNSPSMEPYSDNMPHSGTK